jgi:hypothetical protein
MKNDGWMHRAVPHGTVRRLRDEVAQAWTVTIKDMKVYYLKPGMIMFGFMMPFFMFFSFSVKREMAADQGVARLLALTVFFTAAAAGPFIIPLERRLGTYDRLLAAPMSLLTLLLGKAAVGAFFAIGVSVFASLVGVLAFGVNMAHPWLLAAGVVLSAFSFSALGLIFGSIPTRNPGDVQMPSTSAGREPAQPLARPGRAATDGHCVHAALDQATSAGSQAWVLTAGTSLSELNRTIGQLMLDN